MTTIRLCLLGAAVALAAGCGGSPPAAADPALARDALRQALGAWQKGERPEALLERSPAIRALDPDWKARHRLLRYEVLSEAPFAADIRFTVVLTLQAGGGSAFNKRAIYTVGTSPAISVVREDEP